MYSYSGQGRLDPLNYYPPRSAAAWPYPDNASPSYSVDRLSTPYSHSSSSSSPSSDRQSYSYQPSSQRRYDDNDYRYRDDDYQRRRDYDGYDSFIKTRSSYADTSPASTAASARSSELDLRPYASSVRLPPLRADRPAISSYSPYPDTPQLTRHRRPDSRDDYRRFVTSFGHHDFCCTSMLTIARLFQTV